eukprot:2487701-Pleurochrysis_carterae.AAC.1
MPTHRACAFAQTDEGRPLPARRRHGFRRLIVRGRRPHRLRLPHAAGSGAKAAWLTPRQKGTASAVRSIDGSSQSIDGSIWSIDGSIWSID